MRLFVVAAAVAAMLCSASATLAIASELYISIGAVTNPPIGWTDFCARYAPECDTQPLQVLDVALGPWVWEELKRINKYVNDTVKPMSDLEHWRTPEHWDYPDDGYGDCEDYVLQKRRFLLKLGWPRQALLITFVRDQKEKGHAVLTVKTDRGEYILDNLTDEILLWSHTDYGFIKRQSQTDPNVWVSVGYLWTVGSIKLK
ncbi:MAG: transglutaminase-like cysteine peptidase [Patescibacteria group bacterium]|nr:transglutaminase-like cysteine peptidase [Patescibacteria group bacterium]